MSDSKALSDRIDRLEMHVAHQDQAIEDLNETIQAQSAEIERLGRSLKALVLRLQTLEERPQGPAPVEPPPPHY